MQKKIKSTLLMLTVACIWGFAFVAQATGATVPAMTFNGIRFLLGSLCLIPVVLLFEKRFVEVKKTTLYALVTGTILAVAANMQQYAIQLSGNAGKSSFLTGLYNVMVPIVAWILFKKRAKINVWIGAVVAVVGLYFVCVTDSFGDIQGTDLLLLASDVIWALQILSIGYYAPKVKPIQFSLIQFAVAGVESLLFGFVFETTTFSAIADAWLPILYLGLFSTGVAYTLQVVSQRDADPTVAAIAFSMESVFGTLGAALILHEFMSLRAYFGCVLMFVGMILAQIEIPFRKAQSLKK